MRHTEKFKRLKQAIRLMAMDNGDGFLASHTTGLPNLQQCVAKRLDHALAAVSPAKAEFTELWLATISEEELYTLVVGEEEDQKALKVPEYVERMILAAFECDVTK
jgi:hypothetical protein